MITSASLLVLLDVSAPYRCRISPNLVCPPYLDLDRFVLWAAVVRAPGMHIFAVAS